MSDGYDVAGTCRFGTDPATSVLNTDCRAQRLGAARGEASPA
jgi:choline dehydrogenase-like flavoprotein